MKPEYTKPRITGQRAYPIKDKHKRDLRSPNKRREAELQAMMQRYLMGKW